MNKRKVILIVNTGNDRREELKEEFSQSFQVLESLFLSNADMLLRESFMSIAALFFEISDNAVLYEPLLEKITSFAQSKYIPVFFYLKETTEKALTRAYSLKADNVFPFALDLYSINRCVRSTYEIYRSKWEIDLLLSEQKEQAVETADSIMNVLSNIVELRNAETGYHTSRIRNLTFVLLSEVAEECPEYELTPEKIMLISRASILHDIGKISIPDSIINKPAALTPSEMQTVKTHTVIGGSLIKKFSHVLDSNYLHYAYNIAVYHHERFDGSGYPEGLIGDDIPICAQVVGLADAFDALTNARSYKEAISVDRAANMILNGECGLFSPKLLTCFKNVLSVMASASEANYEQKNGKLPDYIFSLENQKNKNELSDAQIINSVLMHYSGATVIEIMPREQVWHLIFNSDPFLAFVGESSSYDDLMYRLEHSVIAKDDFARFHFFIKTRLTQFVKEGEYRISSVFNTVYNVKYEITLMALSSRDRERLLMFCRPDLRADRLISDEESACNFCSTLAYSVLCKMNFGFEVVEGEEKLLSLMGYTKEEGERLFGHSLREMIHTDDLSSFTDSLNDQIRTSNDLYFIFRLKAKRGEPIWIVLHANVNYDGKESLLYGLIMNLDTVRRDTAKNDIRLEQYRNILSHNRIVAFEYNLFEHRVIYSKAYEEIFGYEPLKKDIDESFTEKSHFHPSDIPQFYNALNALKRGDEHQLIDVRISKIDGEYLWCRIRGTGYYDSIGRLQKVFGIITIIEEEKKHLEKLKQQTELDSLTGSLFNGSAAKKKIGDYLKTHDPHCALIIIDLDDFKNINDTYGHLFGDSVLIEVGRILKSQLRSHDIISRVGGDEFMVMMKNVSDNDFLIKRCNSIIERISNMYAEQFPDLKIGCSIGIATAPEHGTTYENIFRAADTALYKAKKTGKNNCVMYSHSLDALFTPNDITIIDSETSPKHNLGGTEGILPNLFHLFYTSENIENTINTTMCIIGKEMNVSRVYIFENSPDGKYCSNTFEWCNEDIEPQIDVLQSISYEDDIPGYLDNFNEDGIFFCGDIYELEQGAKDILEPQGIKSMLQCALVDKGRLWGYVGFDECKTNRLWPKEQIELLAYFSKIVSVFLRKHRTEQKEEI